MAKDLSEVISAKAHRRLTFERKGKRVAFHSPCSLQHGQKLSGVVKQLLTSSGFELTSIPEPHVCCGSAGPYSFPEPQMADALRYRKLEAPGSGAPDVIATTNIGCQLLLQIGTETRVCHWIELIGEALT